MRVETLADFPRTRRPKPFLTIAGGILGRIGAGHRGAFAAQILDPRLRREEQLRRATACRSWRGSQRRTPAAIKPLGPRNLSAAAAEAYRTLRATISRSTPPRTKAGQVILVTGPSASEGKSTTAVNLASSLALTGQDVILIEADLRRPSLSSVLEVKPSSGGVVSVLIEHNRLSQALVTSPTYGPHLRILLADQSGSGWVTDLFSIPAADAMIRDARRLADFVVIDSPPLNEVIELCRWRARPTTCWWSPASGRPGSTSSGSSPTSWRERHHADRLRSHRNSASRSPRLPLLLGGSVERRSGVDLPRSPPGRPRR